MDNIYNNHQQLQDQHVIDVHNGKTEGSNGTSDENRKTIKGLKDSHGEVQWSNGKEQLKPEGVSPNPVVDELSGYAVKTSGLE